MHRIRSTRARLLVLPFAAALLLGACGGDDEDETTAGESTDTTAAPAEDEGGELEATTGSGEIVVNGTTYAFTSDSCAVGTGDVPEIHIEGTGNSGGREYEVEIIRSQPAQNYVERVTLAWSGTEGSVATKIGGADAVLFDVEDGSAKAASVSFTGGGGAPTGEGTVSFACEQS